MIEKNDCWLDAEAARALLSYDPDTGVLLWKVALSSRGQIGARAGCLWKSGYRMIAIRRRRYKAARLAWLIHHGRWPTADIDHANRLKHDDRLSNLREATEHQNSGNRAPHRVNATGLPGVRRAAGGYFAYIKVHGRNLNLGRFRSPEQAHEAYRAKRAEVFGEFAC